MEEKKQSQNVIMAALSILTSRLGLGRSLGMSYEGKRDLYEALGYPKDIGFKDYEGMYRRQDIAKTIINIKPGVTWSKFPEVTEDEKEETKFEAEWRDLVKKRKVLHFLEKVDRLSGIGQYGVVVLGLKDGKTLDQPASQVKELIYLNCYHNGNVEIKKYEKDATSPRFNQPNEYEIEIEIEDGKTEKKTVHWTRVVHIAEDVCEGESTGTPRLEAVFNRLLDIEKITGGSAEMFWRGAYPGMALEADNDTVIKDPKAIEDEMDEYLHGMRRYLRLQGMEAKPLSPTIADPSKHYDIQISSISAETRIPKRILLGSERGELASNQDERAWLMHIEVRRVKQAEPNILRPFIDRLIELGVLSEPEDGYTVKWEPLLVMSEKERADITKIKTETFVSYANSIGADTLLPPEIFFKKLMDFTQEEIDQINETIKEDLEDDKEIEEEE